MASKKQTEPPMKVQQLVTMPPELKAIVEREAAKAGMTQTAWMVWAIAEKAGRLDLAYVPQKRLSTTPPRDRLEPVPA